MKSLWTTFRYTYTRLRGQTLGWGLGLALYGLFVVPMYKTLGVQPDQFQKMISSYPPEFLAFFGADNVTMLTPAGFLGMYAFSMLPLIVGIFAVMAGSSLIVSDEEQGRLDLIIAHPVGRPAFFWGRSLGLIITAISIMGLGWLGFSVLVGRSGMDFNWGQMAVPFLSLLIQTLLFATLALLLSLILPSRSLAAMISGAFVAISYFMTSLAAINTGLAPVSKVLPYHYYQTVFSLSELNLAWLFGLVGASLAMILIAYLRFIRRDIRLSGEGSWRRK